MQIVSNERGQFEVPQPPTLEHFSPRDVAAVWTAVMRAADIWGLKNSEAATLMAVSLATYDRAKRTPEKALLDQDKLTRASLLLGMFKALRIVFNGPLQAGWMKMPNNGPLFDGQTPLAAMLAGGIPVMMVVRQHLDALRGGA